MKIGRTRFVHLPRRVATVEKVYAANTNPQKTAIVEHASTPARSTAKAHVAPSARVLWREVPNWHSLPGDINAALSTSARAYARAHRLHAAPVAGRIADKVA